MSDKFAILGSLRYEDLHGYEITRRLKAIEGFWYISPGNLYKALNALEREHMVTIARTEEFEGKIRKIYTITEKGKKAFDSWISKPANPPKTRHEAYLKIWLASGDPKKVRIQVEQIKKVSESIFEMMENYDFSTFPEYIRWMMESGRKHVELDVEWANSCLAILDRMETQGTR